MFPRSNHKITSNERKSKILTNITGELIRSAESVENDIAFGPSFPGEETGVAAVAGSSVDLGKAGSAAGTFGLELDAFSGSGL